MPPPSPRVLSIDVGQKNLGLCVVRPGPCVGEDRIEFWAVVNTDVVSAPGVLATLQRAGIMDRLPSITHAVIERQPGRNPTMCRIQHWLEAFLVMRDVPVHVQNSALKLRFAATTPFWGGATATPQSGKPFTYHARKKLSVETTRAFLAATAQDQAWTDVFARARKRDDLADALLQALAYWHQVEPLQDRRRAATVAPFLPRRPSARQLASGKYTKGNVAFLVRDHLRTREAFDAALASNRALAHAVHKHFGPDPASSYTTLVDSNAQIGGAEIVAQVGRDGGLEGQADDVPNRV